MNRYFMALGAWLALVLGPGPALSAQEALPRGFESLTLGLDRAELDRQLQAHPSFLYRGGPDATLLERPNEALIEAEGAYYVRRGWFQLASDRVFLITLDLDTRRLDYFTLFNTFSAKYGPPVSLNPDLARWQDGSTLLTLERPLRVKYIDRLTWEARLAERSQRGTNEALARELFLEKF